MSSGPLTLALAIAMLSAGCASKTPISDCCADVGLNVNPILGPDAVNCGTINTKPQDAATRDRNESAIACVQRAQLRGRPFLVNQGFSIPPDYYLRNVVVFGAQGEKVLLRIEHEHDGPTGVLARCASIDLKSDGQLAYSGCESDETLFSRMK